MKKSICVMVLLSGVLFAAVSSQAAMVTGGVWYDEQNMAIAIDLNHSAWQVSNWMEMDFNTDRKWGQIIEGFERVNINGSEARRFEFGVFRSISYPDGRNVKYFGWSFNPLYDNQERSNWSVYVDKLYYGEVSPEQLQCYTDSWAPKEEKQIVYCQSIDATGNIVPITQQDLDHVFVRHENQEWTPLSKLAPPIPPMILDMKISPAVLKRDSQGKYIVVSISFPKGLVINDNSLDMNLSFQLKSQVDRDLDELHIQPAKWSDLKKTTKNGYKYLTFKLPRQEFKALPLGKATITFNGHLNSKTPLIAEGTITIK